MGVKSMEPSLATSEDTLFTTNNASNESGSVIEYVTVINWPKLSLTTTVYEPALRLDISSLNDPLLQLKIYGGNPPLTVISIDPSISPKQLIFEIFWGTDSEEICPSGTIIEKICILISLYHFNGWNYKNEFCRLV